MEVVNTAHAGRDDKKEERGVRRKAPNPILTLLGESVPYRLAGRYAALFAQKTSRLKVHFLCYIVTANLGTLCRRYVG